jgi:hypothetical protein
LVIPTTKNKFNALRGWGYKNKLKEEKNDKLI